MTEAADQAIFWLVVGLRLLLPLLIPRWPLPGILLSFVIDWVDGSIFRNFTNLPVESYQAYDKALDIYYLAIAYLATLRNWTHLFAFKLGRFLFYFRLIGVLLFEFSGARALLLAFTNAFEYFFIFYEAVRVRWDPLRLSKRALLIAVALIVVLIKLPQEYIVHIAQLNMTDWIKSNILSASTELGWLEAMAAAPGVTLAIVLVLALIVFGLWWLITRKLPPADWKPRFAADPLPPIGAAAQSRRLFNSAFLEKAVLVSLLVIIFAQILPGARASVIQLAVGATLIVILNALVARWLAEGGIDFRSLLIEFIVMAGVSFGAVLLINFIIPAATDGARDLNITLFLVLLLTLIITYYDHFRPAFDLRFAQG
jgi:hypothetical protein